MLTTYNGQIKILNLNYSITMWLYLWCTECAGGRGYVSTAETHRQLPALVLFSHGREGAASSGHPSCWIFRRQPLRQSGTESVLRDVWVIPVSPWRRIVLKIFNMAAVLKWSKRFGAWENSTEILVPNNLCAKFCWSKRLVAIACTQL